MNTRFRTVLQALLVTLALLSLGSEAAANTLNQNVSWTIDRAGTTTKFRVVAYGDSIYAGYNTNLFNAAKYSAATVSGEYISSYWNTDIETVRRTKSGAIASDVYTNKIVAERSYMQDPRTRVVTFEMCGNDGLQARTAFKQQTGTCNFSGMDAALNNCKTNLVRAMDYINANAYPGVIAKVISNVHYPGYAADNVLSTCTVNGARVNMQNAFLPYIAKMNYWMCYYAGQKGFKCADSFAEFMGSDYDYNGDGYVDSPQLRYIAGDTEALYVQRITVTNRAMIRDANWHLVNASTSYDYIQSDDTHPTYTGGTVTAGLLGGSTGSGAPRYLLTYNAAAPAYNPIWNQYGHERMGMRVAREYPYLRP